MTSLRTLALAAGASLVALTWAPAAGHTQARSCKTGRLFAGSPTHRASQTDAVPPSGAKLTDEPPLHFRTLTFSGDTLYTSTDEEVWAADLKTGTLRRVAGERQKVTPQFRDGPCGQARFVNIHGITVLPDRSLVVADNLAHALLRITNPDDPSSCTVAYLAGTHKASSSPRMIRMGDKDGPGAEAMLGKPQWPVADGAGNVYFVDGETRKVKQLGLDDAVSTLAKLPRDGGLGSYRGMTLLGDKLYTIGNTFSTGHVHEVDTRNGKVRQVAALTAKRLPEIGQNQAVALSSIATDGKELFVSTSGYIFRLNPRSGKAVHVAGAGNPADFPRGYDPAARHPAKQVLLRYRVGDQSHQGTNTALAFHDGALYWRGRGESPYVVKIDCP